MDKITPITLAATGCTLLVTSVCVYKLFFSPSSSPSPSSTPSEPEKEDTRPLLNIYFGSQTGTAEGLCRVIEREGKERGFNAQVIDLEDWDEDSHQEFIDKSKKAVCNVFLMATYGEGEPTDNAAQFIKLLKNEGSDFEFPHAVFGLGNTQYEFYNAMGKLVDKKMGGEKVVEYGEGDDDKNLEEDFEAWKDGKFWEGIGGMAGEQQQSDAKPENANKVIWGDSPSSATPNPSTKFYFDAKPAKITVNRELLIDTSNGANSTKHIEVTLPAGAKYNTADNAGILPHNPAAIVKSLINHLGLDGTATFTTTTAIFPTPTTVFTALTKYTDLLSPPRRSDLKLLAKYAPPGLSKDLLLRLSSKEGKSEYESKVLLPHLGLHSLLVSKCPDVKLTFEDLLNVSPRLQPRYYTISSSSTVHPRSFHMTVAVTKGTNSSTSEKYTGLCSGHLSVVKECDAFIRESSFKLPSDTKPIIMIGPGTGYAPMRALLQERVKRGAEGPNVLFFGCRKSNEDWLYKDEMKELIDSKGLELYTAFSREGPTKVYVQNVMEKEASRVKQLVKDGAWVYVCGATRMGADVVKTLKGIVGEKKVKEMQEKGELIQELWA
ncbi:hypothetical protein TrST_g4891 [Triparma strigata]|uniref:NADPH--hemoprotein reductase n=1 Tax=Triparma strigata TaxID=1606541 RepID=A0A9W7AGQ1_9STRA|nr:hypothetical protein TrST_g4891 [Triparma strigata]